MPEYAVAGIWSGSGHGASVLMVDDGVLVRVEPAAATHPHTSMTVIPGLIDRHVHLGLVDPSALTGSAVVEVHDLGWTPDEISALRDAPPAGLTVRMAGPFHTAPGGYPSGRPWAPGSAVRAVGSAADVHRVVAQAARSRYDILKVALHSGMPLLDDELLRALVTAAHDVDLPVAVHVEGAGQAARAIDAGADVLAHAPWSERLDDDLLFRGRHMTWYSTLAIHTGDDRARAIDNVRRFRSAGGRVLYGTDMGNGPTPVDVNAEEILALGAAGLEGDELLAALTGGHGDRVPLDRLLVSPHALPGNAPEAVSWLADSRRFPAADLKERHVVR